MSVSEILDTTFRLYRERFVTFLLIALIVYVPYSLLATFVSAGADGRGLLAAGSADWARARQPAICPTCSGRDATIEPRAVPDGWPAYSCSLSSSCRCAARR